MGKKTKNKGRKTSSGNTASTAGPSRTSTQSSQQQTSTKRQRNSEGKSKPKDRGDDAVGGSEQDGEDLLFEDPFGDEFEPEDVEVLEEEEGRNEERHLKTEAAAEGNRKGDADEGGIQGMEVEGDEDGTSRQKVQTKVWRAGVDELAEGEELDYDPTAYHMYHSLRPEWPCLSFDIIRDNLGLNRSRFPHTIFAVTGTQADRAENNRLQVMKLSELHRTRKVASGSDDEGDSGEDELDETDDDPVLDHVSIPHRGGVNRLRSMPQRPHVIATWSETSDVHVWDLGRQVSALVKGAPRTSKVDPVFSFGGHKEVRSGAGRFGGQGLLRLIPESCPTRDNVFAQTQSPTMVLAPPVGDTHGTLVDVLSLDQNAM